VKVVCRVVCTGNNVADSVEDSDPETEYLALVENSSLLALISAAVNDPTGSVAGIEGVFKFVLRDCTPIPCQMVVPRTPRIDDGDEDLDEVIIARDGCPRGGLRPEWRRRGTPDPS
jgi:hypothetical protein